MKNIKNVSNSFSEILPPQRLIILEVFIAKQVMIFLEIS